MFEIEESIERQGFHLVAGVDEVGRGSLYGDVLAAAVVFPPGVRVEEAKDSKACTARERERLFAEIQRKALAIGIGVADPDTIDRVNIRQASRLAMLRAVQALQVEPEYLLVDAEQVDGCLPQRAVVHGDALCHVIAAASIVAKVTRDRLCHDWEQLDPGYGIARHKGYATAFHRERIRSLGATPRHRQTFLGRILSMR